jgi:hypothetical protein
MRPWAFLLLVPLVVSCRGSRKDDEILGALGNGVFRYLCVDASDPVCGGSSTASRFPERVGVEGVFGVDFEPLDEALYATSVDPVAPDIVDVQSGRFYAASAGVSALLARRTNGRVVDIVHMEVVDVAGIQLQSMGATPSLVYTVGRRTQLSAAAVDEYGATVAGARAFTWSVSDPGVLRLERPNPTPSMDVTALRAGRARITVTTGQLTATLDVVVEGTVVVDAGPVTPDAGRTEGGTSADASRDASPGVTPDAGGTGAEAGTPAVPDAARADAAREGGGG